MKLLLKLLDVTDQFVLVLRIFNVLAGLNIHDGGIYSKRTCVLDHVEVTVFKVLQVEADLRTLNVRERLLVLGTLLGALVTLL